MIIKRLFITGYKNLLDCDFSPQKVHAITGCNGSGKSNVLEVLPFVIGLLSGSDQERENALMGGKSPNGSWFPRTGGQRTVQPFQFVIECILSVADVPHVIEYNLRFDQAEIEEFDWGAKILSEVIKTKVVGAVGMEKTVLIRKRDGEVRVNGGKTPRSRSLFKCKADMSALHALEVREADEFSKKYPVLAEFKKALLATKLIRLDPEAFRQTFNAINRKPYANKLPGRIISTFDPYHLLREIQRDKETWHEFAGWLKYLVDVDGLTLMEIAKGKKVDFSNPVESVQYIFPKQHGRPLQPGELSMGSTVVVGYLTILYTLFNQGGAVIFEEPENYLHPKAVVDLIKLFREFSEDHTILFSTHSPVAINSMKPEEVSVMRPVSGGFVTVKNVSAIKEATEALDRGFLSFGDLLQTDYATK